MTKNSLHHFLSQFSPVLESRVKKESDFTISQQIIYEWPFVSNTFEKYIDELLPDLTKFVNLSILPRKMPTAYEMQC